MMALRNNTSQENVHVTKGRDDNNHDHRASAVGFLENGILVSQCRVARDVSRAGPRLLRDENKPIPRSGME
jgi:hypothetical protein